MVNWKPYVDKLGIDKLEKVPGSLKSLKSKVDKPDVHKLKCITADLKKSSNAIDNVAKKTIYNELVKTFNAIDANELVNK